MRHTAPRDNSELEAIEQREWLESLDYVLQQGAGPRPAPALRAPAPRARRTASALPFTANTPYINTIPPDEQPPLPGSREIERRIKSLVRWNAMAMVVRANTRRGRHRRPHLDLRLGRHAVRGRLQPLLPRRRTRAAPATSSTSRATPSPGIYARAFLEGRLADRAARELPPRAEAGRRPVVVSAPVADARLLGVPDGVDGPRPDHGDLPGALQPLPGGSRPEASDPTRKVWAFLGDGETDEPEALGAITLAVAREARQPDLRHQLQPAAARRPGARQRQDHPGAGSRSSAAPAGT